MRNLQPSPTQFEAKPCGNAMVSYIRRNGTRLSKFQKEVVLQIAEYELQEISIDRIVREHCYLVNWEKVRTYKALDALTQPPLVVKL